MRFIAKIALIVVCVCMFSTMVRAEEDVKDAVVKVFVAHNGYDYNNPWMKSGQKSRTGSGCVIAGKRILTNAHVVSDQTFIQVKKAGDAKKYIAKLKMVAHDCDLAILSVKDDAFFDNVKPIKIGDLPKVRDRVAVYGFPEGGDELSITEGVVSRVT